MSTNFYSNQLSDIFAYELPTSTNSVNTVEALPKTNTVLVYNYHNLYFQERFYIFSINFKTTQVNPFLTSVAELFPNAN
tara:strand:+ start:311 stop:547 length:237 start_codon:yes stop_codon:yes gene_type:complete